MQPEQQQRIMGYFIEEAKDHLNTIEQGLLNLQSTIADSEAVNEIFRAAHSVKGGAAMLGLNSIQHVSHRLEDFFKLLKEVPVQVDQKLESLFLRVFDALQELVNQLQGPFGLTDESASATMTAIEPVFEELEQHLAGLASSAGVAPVAIATGLTMSANTLHLDNALQQTFQGDVPIRLREMLQLFKRPDSDLAARDQLQDICQQLSQLGTQRELDGWCRLLETARQAISNLDNPNRTLAPIIIKDIKHAQELILAGRFDDVIPCPELQDLLPMPLLDEGDIAADYEFADLLADTDSAELGESLDLPGVTDVSNVSLTDLPELDFDALDLPLSDEVGSSSMVSEPVLAERHGPEVGMAELNSLADLFEGEDPDLGFSWQTEEEVIGDAPEALAANASRLDDESTDFSDLLFDGAVPTNGNELSDEDDFNDLFGDELLDEDSSAELGAADATSDNDDLDDLFDLAGTDSVVGVEVEPDHQYLAALDSQSPDASDDLDDASWLTASASEPTQELVSGESPTVVPESHDLDALFSGLDDDQAAGASEAQFGDLFLTLDDENSLDEMPLMEVAEPSTTDFTALDEANLSELDELLDATPAAMDTDVPSSSTVSPTSSVASDPLGLDDLDLNFDSSSDLDELLGPEIEPADSEVFASDDDAWLTDMGDSLTEASGTDLGLPDMDAAPASAFDAMFGADLADTADTEEVELAVPDPWVEPNHQASATAETVELSPLDQLDLLDEEATAAPPSDEFDWTTTPDLFDLSQDEPVLPDTELDSETLEFSDSSVDTDAISESDLWADEPGDTTAEPDLTGLFDAEAEDRSPTDSTDSTGDEGAASWLDLDNEDVALSAVDSGDLDAFLSSGAEAVEDSRVEVDAGSEIESDLNLDWSLDEATVNPSGDEAFDWLIEEPTAAGGEAADDEHFDALFADADPASAIADDLFEPGADDRLAQSPDEATAALELADLEFSEQLQGDDDLDALLMLEDDAIADSATADAPADWLDSMPDTDTPDSLLDELDDYPGADLTVIQLGETEPDVRSEELEDDLLALHDFTDGPALDQPEEQDTASLEWAITEEPTAELDDFFGNDLTSLTATSTNDQGDDLDGLLDDFAGPTFESEMASEPSETEDLTELDSWLGDESAPEPTDRGIEPVAFSSDTAHFDDLDHLLAETPAETDQFDDLDALLDEAEEPLVHDTAALDTGDHFADLDALLDEDEASLDFTAVSGEGDHFADLDALLDEDEGAATSEFADLDTLLDTDTGSGDSNDFADLEALLDDDVDESLASQLGSGSAASSTEFDELDDLLKDAEEKMGGSPTMKVSRGLAQSARRTPRPGRALGEQTMRVPVKHLDNLSNLVGELVVNRNSLEQDQERLRQSLDNLLYQVQQLSDVGQRMQDLYERSLLESSLFASRQGHRVSAFRGGSTTPEPHPTGVEYDPLEMDRFTGFHSLSQEMIELIVRVRESSSDIEFIVDEAEQVTRMFRQVTTQLQEGLTRSRMVPFAQTADRLPRAVRDISLKVGKQAELVVEGRETLIDKMILEQLYDPMTHLVNNAITHGIESPEIRRSLGKSPVGRITIRAFHQGNQTIISVADDGAGIDVDRVKAKALEKGLVNRAEANSMSRLDAYDLLFHPGFSTKDQADDFSGRGVGMDVVRTSLSEIRGVINTDSNPGKGTNFTIRLPLTLSISKALCCISDRARIAFPMDGVEDMLDVPKERIQTNEEGQPCISWRDTILPIRPLTDLLTYNRQMGRSSVYGGHQEDDIISIVVLRSAGNFLALQVDQVLGEQEIVIKQLEGPIPKPVGVAGATVLGDGRIMPIADVLELIDLSVGRLRKDASSSLWDQGAAQVVVEPPVVKTEPMVLIVDDSITVRELLSMTFNKVGYRVEQARDGQEAWEKLRSGLPCDIVFCDIEMPRMDGLELLSRIQKDPALTDLPIAMLTSRGADRHRQMASTLGAKGYFTKPYLEEALLDAAQRMLKGENLLNGGA